MTEGVSSGSERDEKRLADDAARIALSRVLTSSLDLISVVLLVHLLVKEDVAAFAFLLLVYETAKHFATLGFPDSVLYFFERLGRGARRAFALQTGVLLVLSGAVACAALLALQALVHLMLPGWSDEALSRVRALLPFFAVVVLLEVPTWPTANILIAVGRSRDAAWWQLASSVLLFGALFGPLVAGQGPEGVAWALVVYAVVRFVGSMVWVHRALDGPRAPLPAGTLRDQIRFSLPLGANLLATRVNRYADKFIVAALLTDAALADYQVGAQELPVVTVIPYAVGALLIGRLVGLAGSGDRDAMMALWRRSIEKVSLLVLPVALFAIAMAGDIVLLLFGEAYLGAVPVFQLYGIILLQRVAQYGAMLQAHADTRAILRITLAMLVLNVALSIPLTLTAGIAGTALATVISSLSGWWLYQRRIAGLTRSALSQVIPWKHYLGVLAVSGTVAGALLVIRQGFATEWSSALALAVMGVGHVVVVAVLVRVTGLASRTDLQALRRWLSPAFLFR